MRKEITTNHPDITRYDGTRYITRDEIDREFTGQWVLIRKVPDKFDDGYLVASSEGRDELRPIFTKIAIREFDSDAKVIYGCERGDNLHVQLLG